MFSSTHFELPERVPESEGPAVLGGHHHAPRLQVLTLVLIIDALPAHRVLVLVPERMCFILPTLPAHRQQIKVKRMD